MPRPGEPLWHPEDLDAAVDFERLLAEVCARCGTRDEEWRDPATLEERDPPPYVAVGVRCAGCQAKARKDREFNETWKDSPADADGVGVVLVPWSDATEDDDAEPAMSANGAG